MSPFIGRVPVGEKLAVLKTLLERRLDEVAGAQAVLVEEAIEKIDTARDDLVAAAAAAETARRARRAP